MIVCVVALSDFRAQSVEDAADYRRKLESVMEATVVPTLWLRLPVLVLSRKPSDQWSVGGAPQRILPGIKKEINLNDTKRQKVLAHNAGRSTMSFSEKISTT